MHEQLQQSLKTAALKTVHFLERQMDDDGAYGADATDLACYYKSPMLFYLAGRRDLAGQVLSQIKQRFMTDEGDFVTSEGVKSVKGEYVEFWCYTNGWITRAARQLARSDIDALSYEYLMRFYVGENQGFLANSLDRNSGITDVITVAHHGLINLERGNLKVAISAGNYLCDVFAIQPDLQKGFYLRRSVDGGLLTDFESALSPFYFVSKREPEQLYFMIAYPCAYLALLYQSTQDVRYLESAKAYLDFALSSHQGVYRCKFSHKLAWAASIVYSITGEEPYLEAVERIITYFMEMQSEEGMWFLSDDVNVAYDQSAEIAAWFFDIANYLDKVNNEKKRLDPSPQVDGSKAEEEHRVEGSLFAKCIAGLVSGIGLYVAYKHYSADSGLTSCVSDFKFSSPSG